MNKTLFFTLTIVLTFVVAIFIGAGISALGSKKTIPNKTTSLVTVVPSPTISRSNSDYFVFVPSGGLKKDIIPVSMAQYQNPTSFIYFSLSSVRGKLSKTDLSWKNWQKFTQLPLERKWLTFSIFDPKEIEFLAKDETAVNSLIQEVVSIAKSENIIGIVLDIETKDKSKAPFILRFHQLFGQISKQENLISASAIYASANLENMPYDIPLLYQTVDKIFFMAYDLYKNQSMPGPNFPLYGGGNFILDLQTQLASLPSSLDRSHFVYVLGSYGYDWEVTIEKKIKSAPKAMSLENIRNTYLNNCNSQNCTITRDENAKEQEISFVDKNGNYHLIWFDDEISIKNKIDYLQNNKINSFGIWAWGYY